MTSQPDRPLGATESVRRGLQLGATALLCLHLGTATATIGVGALEVPGRLLAWPNLASGPAAAASLAAALALVWRGRRAAALAPLAVWAGLVLAAHWVAYAATPAMAALDPLAALGATAAPFLLALPLYASVAIRPAAPSEARRYPARAWLAVIVLGALPPLVVGLAPDLLGAAASAALPALPALLVAGAAGALTIAVRDPAPAVAAMALLVEIIVRRLTWDPVAGAGVADAPGLVLALLLLAGTLVAAAAARSVARPVLDPGHLGRGIPLPPSRYRPDARPPRLDP